MARSSGSLPAVPDLPSSLSTMVSGRNARARAPRLGTGSPRPGRNRQEGDDAGWPCPQALPQALEDRALVRPGFRTTGGSSRAGSGMPRASSAFSSSDASASCYGIFEMCSSARSKFCTAPILADPVGDRYLPLLVLQSERERRGRVVMNVSIVIPVYNEKARSKRSLRACSRVRSTSRK